jgi:hypothetical protein
MPHKIPALVACWFLILSPAAEGQQPTTEPQDKHPSGSTVSPQEPTGPVNTKSGGAPASSPQGETPPGMQAAPKGSSEPIRTDRRGVVEGTSER